MIHVYGAVRNDNQPGGLIISQMIITFPFERNPVTFKILLQGNSKGEVHCSKSEIAFHPATQTRLDELRSSAGKPGLQSIIYNDVCLFSTPKKPTHAFPGPSYIAQGFFQNACTPTRIKKCKPRCISLYGCDVNLKVPCFSVFST